MSLWDWTSAEGKQSDSVHTYLRFEAHYVPFNFAIFGKKEMKRDVCMHIYIQLVSTDSPQHGHGFYDMMVHAFAENHMMGKCSYDKLQSPSNFTFPTRSLSSFIEWVECPG